MSLGGIWQHIENSKFDALAGSIPQIENCGNVAQVFAGQTRPKVINFDEVGGKFMKAYPSGLDFPSAAPSVSTPDRTAQYTLIYTLAAGEIQVTELNTADTWLVDQVNFSAFPTNGTPVANRASYGTGITTGGRCWATSSGVHAETIQSMPTAYEGLPQLLTDAGRANSYEGGSGDMGYSFSMTFASLNRSFKVYLAHDDQLGGTPSWLSLFIPTDDEIITSGGGRLRVYQWGGTLSPGVPVNWVIEGNKENSGRNPDSRMCLVFFEPVDDSVTSGTYPDTDYEWAALEEDAVQYNDRDFTWPAVADEFVGGKFLLTSFDDRRETAVAYASWTPPEWLQVTFKYSMDVYMLVDEELYSDLETAWLTDAGWAYDSSIDVSAMTMAGKTMRLYKKTVAAAVAEDFSGNGSPDDADEDSEADNLVAEQTWYFYSTFYRSWDGHEGPPSEVSTSITTGTTGNVLKIILTVTGISEDTCDQIRLYAQLSSVGSAYCLVPDMVVQNPGAGNTDTVEFDFTIEQLLSYAKKLDFGNRFKLPACKYATMYKQADRLLMWGQNTFVPSEGDKVTMRNYAFYTQYSGQLRLRVEFDPANGSTPTDADLWKTLVVNNLAIGEIFYITEETSLWNYSGTVTVAYCVEAYLPQIYASGVAITEFTIDGSDSIEYDHLAGHKNRIWYTSIVPESDRDAVGTAVWQGMNPGIYLEEEFNGEEITAVHVEDNNVYVATDGPNLWRVNGIRTRSSWSYEKNSITYNRGVVSPLSPHSVRNSKAHCLDQTGVIEIGPSSADSMSDILGARELFYDTFSGSNLKLAQGVFDQRNEQSIFYLLTHEDSASDYQDRIVVDKRNGVIGRENTGHTITALIAITDDNGFQRLVYGDDKGYIGEYKKASVFTDHVTSDGYECWIITGAEDFGSPRLKHLNKFKIFGGKSAEGASTKEVVVGIFGAQGDIDPGNINFKTYYDDQSLLELNALGVNVQLCTVNERDLGKWLGKKVDGTHFIIFIAGESDALPETIGKLYFDIEEHTI